MGKKLIELDFDGKIMHSTGMVIPIHSLPI
jgi:hypothetical protein